ncbi:MAG: energy transducer TonB [Chitinophagaceae bacterium]|nr:energy transducer TonB [Chitinophagaceae bacterium]
MRSFFLLTLTLFYFTAQAQKIETYYDWQWKVCDIPYARFFSVVEKADTVWKRTDYYITELRLQMKGSYKDHDCKIKHGSFNYFHSNGNLSSAGLYLNNKKQGLWLSYHINGMMRDSTVYDAERPMGTGLGWHANGVMSDSNVYNPDGSAVKVDWFDNGQLSSAGRTVNNKQQGKWQYFSSNGNLCARELFDTGKLVSRVYFNEDGSAISDTASRDREAVCKKNWQLYLQNNLYFPANLKIVNSDQATVVVNFTIDEDGKIKDAYVSSSFHFHIDQIALDVLKNGPGWIPAIDHNRKVKAYRRQPMTFVVQQD